jgi:hypothetical protein
MNSLSNPSANRVNNTNSSTFIMNKKQDYRNMIAGFISSLFSRTICAPLDRLKMLYQVNYYNKVPPKIIVGLKQIYYKEGFTGYFRGNFINIMKGSPETGIKLYLFEKIKWKFQCYYNREKFSNSFMLFSGAASGAVATIIVFPLEVMKLRIGATDKKSCLGLIKTAKGIYREPGGIRNFYSGLEASIVSSIPNAGILLYSYEKLKWFITGTNSIDNANNLSCSLLVVLGGISAMISSTVLYPLQMVQARMIMYNLKEHEYKHIDKISNFKNFNLMLRFKFFKSIYTIFHKEGILGFYKGYSPALLKTIVGNGTGFGIYEKVKLSLGVNK